MKLKRTKVIDQEHKIDIIEHVNNDHVNELREIVSAHSSYKEVISIKLDDLFEEGCLLSIEVTQGNFKELFVPFTIKGDLEEKVLYLAYKSMIDNGKNINSSKKQYFTLCEKFFVTKNILRLVIKSDSPIPTENAGFSYLFSLKKLQKIGSTNNKTQASKMSVYSKVISKFFLFVLKILSTKQRTSIMQAMNKNNRYYTVRKAWEENANYFAFVDVYIHGDTQGSNWARSLEQGDIIGTLNEYKEKTQHLKDGKALLIADETALPALASILEAWENSVCPSVIVITNCKEEQTYLKDIAGSLEDVSYLDNSANLYSDIVDVVNSKKNIGAVWGALEKDTAKQLRKYFRNVLKINSKQTRLIGYWKK